MTVLLTYCTLAAILLVGSVYLEMKRKPMSEGIEFMDKQHTEVIKGIAIMCVVLSHVGNANGTRILAPGGGIGVALFLICSGYGLSESARKGVNLGKFWKRRIINVFLPYALIRVIAFVVSPSDVTIVEFLLDVTCIKPRYMLGWYLSYLFFCYVVFSVYQLVRRRFGKKAMVLMAAVAVISFFASPTELQAEQSLSFMAGVFLSENKESAILGRLKARSWMVTAVAFLVGSVAFLLKQLDILNFSYWVYLLQMIYKFGWAVMLLTAVWTLMKRFSLNPAALIGKYSYEIYLTHGYMFALMRSIVMIPLFILCVGIASAGLHCGIDYMRKISS